MIKYIGSDVVKRGRKSPHIRASRYVLLFFVLNFAISHLCKYIFHANIYISQIFAVVLPLVGVTFLFASRYGGNLQSYFRLFKINIRTAILMILLGICTSAAGSYINIPMRYLSELLKIAPQGVFAVPDNLGSLMLNAIFVAVLPAICEEFFCRGILLREYERYNKVTAVLMSSIYFGLLHSSIFNLPYTIFLGVVLAMVCLNTGSIFSCMILHFSANMFSLLWAFAVYNIPEFSYDLRFYATLDAVIGVLAVMFILLFALFIMNRNKFKSRYFRYSEMRRNFIYAPRFGLSISLILVIILCVVTGIW